MSEKISNRREIASTEYEQTKQYQAMQYLNRIGVVKKVNQIGLFHGRDGDGTGGWQVDPNFDNSDNNTGHRNINKRSALNTSDFGTAHEFSIARSQGTTAVAEVHHIVSDDPDAVIIDRDAFLELNRSQKNNANRAIRSTLIGVTDGAPLDFENRHALDHYTKRDFQNEYGLMFDEEVDSFSRKLNLDNRFVKRIGSAINTRNLLQNGYLTSLCNAFMDNNSSIEVKTDEGRMRSAPISHEYLANWFRKNHIVGYKTKVRSATLKGQVVDDYLLFDLEKVNTDKEIEKRNREREQLYGKIAIAASKNNAKNAPGRLLSFLSENLYIKPKDIVHLAKLTPGFKQLFEADAGNWEKFKLEEHTETALKVFDDNYADEMPASILPTMRLALLVHDIGKSEAVKHHEKENQYQYNLYYADHFLKENQVNESTAKLIMTMIGEGKEWAERWMIRRDRSSGTQFYSFCEKTMKEYLKTDRVDPKTVFGFRIMLEVLQTCDSAAYTTMAVTRAANGVVYKNYGSFDSTFDSYHGLTGTRARIK